MNKKTIRDIDLYGKKVIVRCDFNVPLDENLNITDNRRIVSCLPTIDYLLEQNCKVILISHLGRPKGEVNEKYSLKPVQKELSRLLKKDIKLSKDVVGENTFELASKLKPREIILLENIRFDPREEKNDDELSILLSRLGDVYVNDAFGTSHRAHCSTEGISKYLPAVAGFLIEKEIEYLGKSLENPEREFIAILGGAKVQDKINIIYNLIKKVDSLIIGGAMAYTFLKSKGFKTGDSLVEEDKIDLAIEILKEAKAKGVKIFLPVDNHIAKSFSNESEDYITDDENIPDGFMGLDIGPKTVKLYKNVLLNAKTIVFNGTLGVCEFEKYEAGTKEIAQAITKIDGVTSIVGGGDSASAIEKFGLSNKFTHISTGGGASLEFLEGKKLPGIECLLDK